MIDPLTGLGALNATLTAYEKVSKIFRDLIKTQPNTPDKQEAEKNLKQAEESLQLAKAELAAKGFGYLLCRLHFPPGIMIQLPEDTLSGRTRRKCETCGNITPKEESQPTGQQRESWVRRGKTKYF